MDRLGSTKEETGLFKHSSSGVKKCREIDQNAVHVLVERLSKETRKRENEDDIKNEKTIVTSYGWCDGKLLHFHPKPLDGTWH